MQLILTGSEFTFNGLNSSDYDMRFMWLDRDEPREMAGEFDYTFFEQRADHTYRTVRDTNKEGLSFDVEMISTRVLNPVEARNIYARMFNLRNFHELAVTDEDGETLYFNCIFSNPQRYEYGIGKESGIVGFGCTMTLDSPFAYSAIKTVILSDSPQYRAVNLDDSSEGTFYTYQESNGSYKNVQIRGEEGIEPVKGTQYYEQYYTETEYDGLSDSSLWVLNVDSDDHHYIYPEAVITIASEASNGDTAKVSNKADRIVSSVMDVTDRDITFDCKGGKETVTMSPKSGTMIAVANNERYNKVGDSNKKFIRVLAGKNLFYHDKIESIQLTYREARAIL